MLVTVMKTQHRDMSSSACFAR